MENSSYEYSRRRVKLMIEREKEKYGWEFLFLGANIDAVAEGGRMGFRADRSVRYMHDGVGTGLVYDSVNNAVRNLRTKKQINDDWDVEIRADFAARHKDHGRR